MHHWELRSFRTDKRLCRNLCMARFKHVGFPQKSWCVFRAWLSVHGTQAEVIVKTLSLTERITGSNPASLLTHDTWSCVLLITCLHELWRLSQVTQHIACSRCLKVDCLKDFIPHTLTPFHLWQDEIGQKAFSCMRWHRVPSKEQTCLPSFWS